MKRHNHLKWMRGLLAALMVSMGVWGFDGAATEPYYEPIVKRMTPDTRRQFELLTVFAPTSLQDVKQATRADRIEEKMREIAALGNLAIGARAHDVNGRAPIHRYVLDQLQALSGQGVEYLGSMKGVVAVPVLAKPARATVDDQSWVIHPIWPNGPLPTACPEDGLEGPLVYVGVGGWEEINGLDLDGAIVLMGFAGGRNWERLFSLGAQAVLVMEDQHVTRSKAEGLFCNTPVPFPRFYVDREAGGALQALAASRRAAGAGTWEIQPGRTVRIEGGQVYENRPWESLFAYLPPTAPVVYEVKVRDLIERIAADLGVNARELEKINNLDDGPLAPGRSLAIPNSANKYKVVKDDLLKRIANSFGLGPEEVMKANDLKVGELQAGQRLVIPNFDESLVLLTRLDSVSSVPDLPHGAHTIGNLAATLATLEHLATGQDVIRRKGLLVVFVDGDTMGGVGSRTFAEYILHAQNQLRPSEARSKQDVNIFPVLALALMTLQAALLAWVIYHFRRRSAWMTVMAGIGVLIVGSGVLWLAYRLVERQKTEVVTHDTLTLYRQAVEWMRSPDTNPLDPVTAEWLGREWLGGKIEQYRVNTAERRIALLLALRDETNPEKKRALNEQLKLEQERLDAVTQLRKPTLENRRLNWTERLRALYQALEQSAGPTAVPMRWSALKHQIESEYQDELTQATTREGNMALARLFREKQRPLSGVPSGKPVLGWQYDFSDGTGSMGIRGGEFRGGLPAADAIGVLGKYYREVLAYASHKAGWEESWPVLTDADRRDQIVLNTSPPTVYGDMWASADVALVPLSTLNDMTVRLDTPRDVLAETHFANLSVQMRTALLLMRLSLESPMHSMAPSRFTKPNYARVVGQTVEFNIRSGIDARQPVPQCYVYTFPWFESGTDNPSNTSTYRGVRRGVTMITLLNGGYRTPLDAITKSYRPMLYAYRFNRPTGLFDKVMEQAPIGTQEQSVAVNLFAGRESEKNLILTDVYPRVMFPGTDPVGYSGIGARENVEVLDAVSRGRPAHYAIEIASKHFGESDVVSMILHLPVRRSAQVVVRQRGGFKMLLLGAFTPDNPRGTGYKIGPQPDGGRNLVIPLTSMEVADSMNHRAQEQIALYRRFGITDRNTEAVVARAQEKLETARRARAEHYWQESIGASREAWGILIRYYPRIMQMAREAVFSVVILMILLVPASVFMEQLILGSKSVVARLAGVCGIFVMFTMLLKLVHPAFQISVSPFVLMTAFMMILMATVVLGICYQRFEVLVRRARIAGGETESEEISLASSLGTALNLGVSNLKKRITRTVLTAMTVSVLTFSIVAFVSVRGQDTLSYRPVVLDRDVEGEQVEPVGPFYEGVLFRNFYWTMLSKDFVSSISSEFGTRFETTTRGHYVQREGGSDAEREGANQIEILFRNKRHMITGLMGFEANETRFSQLHRAVSRQQWLPDVARSEAAGLDRFVIILPDVAAESLGIGEEMIFDETGKLRPSAELPVVRMMNRTWQVVGILDTGYADRIRDLTGRSLAMVDYVRSAFTTAAAAGTDVITEPTSYHMSWRRLAIVPLAALGDLIGAPLYRSVVVGFGDASKEQVQQFYQDVAMRLDRSMFSRHDNTLAIVTTQKQRSVAGLAKIIVPVVLCILIVTNTMMGNVDERKGEVAMLGAVGLSPRQISFLLLSESTVFSVIGIILGTSAGLLFANTIPWLVGHWGVTVSGLSFNFTSLSAVVLALGTGVVVLVATLIPARKAAALAAPSGMAKWVLPEAPRENVIDFELPFSMTRGNAIGMIAFFRRFMLNHTEATSADFNCRNIAVRCRRDDQDALVVLADMWLSPYDLDVAQQMELHIHTTDTPGVYRVRLKLMRTSGTEEAWLRTNYGFMDLVRLQFLLWRNLNQAGREAYIQEGVELIQTTIPTAHGN